MNIKIKAKNKVELKNFFDTILEPKDLNKSLNNVVLKGTEDYINLVLRKIVQRKKIIIIGDYDVDGITSSAIMLKTLAYLGANVEAFLPNRFADGYGLNPHLIEMAINKNASLIITVDNGIRENDSIEIARKNNIDVIITDHHIAPSTLPNANLIINPHINNPQLACEDICGAMVAYLLNIKLLDVCSKAFKDDEAVLNSLKEEIRELAAIGTICDVMPLEGENRQIVKYLLNLMQRNEDTNEGIHLLMHEMKLKNLDFDVESVSYGLGPALNASGRLESATTSLKLLMNGDQESLKKVMKLNDERKDKTSTLVSESESQINADDEVNVIYFPSVNEGIIGIIAGKIAEKTAKPTFIFTKSEDEIKGSARGPEWANLIEIAEPILKSKDYTIKFGGHAQAMGLSLKSIDCLDDFKQSLNDAVRPLDKTVEEQVYFDYPVDMSLEDVKSVLDNYEPFGEAFPEPVFVVRRSPRLFNKIGTQHLSFKIFLDKKTMIDCFYFFCPNIEELIKAEGTVKNIYFTINRETNADGNKTKYSAYVKKIE